MLRVSNKNFFFSTLLSVGMPVKIGSSFRRRNFLPNSKKLFTGIVFNSTDTRYFTSLSGMAFIHTVINRLMTDSPIK